MPRNAVATGCVDLVATPRGIAEELVAISGSSYIRRPAQEPEHEEAPEEEDDGPLQALFRMLRGGTGVDFSRYKQNTVRRRVARRMAVRRLERLADYVRYLEDHPPELSALHDELLINVTAFFRDPELFRTLAERVFPALTDGRAPDEPLRVWVAGCSTGEEAYSIAIAFLEFAQARHLTLSMQMFATDVSERAIARARAGVYGEGIRASVSERRLRRFFTRSSTGAFQVAPQVRDLCIFARHDVTRDPPFSRLDLVSCRNVLIYMDGTLQRRVLPMFHYALRPKGFLALGSSESADRFPGLFAPVEGGFHLFAKVAGTARPDLSQASAERAPRAPEASRGGDLRRHDAHPLDVDVDVAREADRLLLTTYVPTGIVVDERGHIVHFRGDTSRYLKVPSGPATFRLTSMVREELFLPLESALREAQERGVTVRREHVAVRGDGDEWLDVGLEVIPLRGKGGPSGHHVVVFESARPAPAAAPAPSPSQPDDDLSRMRVELDASRRQQQLVIEKLEGTNEELRSANEEVLSSNEELQSANEELETAKEELQSGSCRCWRTWSATRSSSPPRGAG
jgi:two-component system CheB/CheR fusion protein